jgi:hypothetical protein
MTKQQQIKLNNRCNTHIRIEFPNGYNGEPLFLPDEDDNLIEYQRDKNENWFASSTPLTE